ncbi:uncharacterized protein ColSpa_06961 [Colletotrichum spaethianum]|uniref:TLC domain-containing protein n=1 Tax=Colletotrichum spaethianum TaxID=700344 RepID=A0AA37LIV8_9PEZI|nr:uncharacterized protein ColSpa_06961 [Colletotrichum spaethianum]GKT46780.1 hypothetical protein ColSpa_06961 [Colletotrichum spaethianum]
MASVASVLAARSPPKIETIPNGPISSLQPFGSLLFVSSIIIVMLVANILERWLLQVVYGEIYAELQRPGSEKRRRSFTYYHVGAITMFAILCIGAYPVMHFLVGSADLATDVVPGPGSRIRVGDLLFAVSQTYSAYYAFELCYRTKFASPLSIAHHIGLLAITQTALSLFGSFRKHPEATIEFYMCMVWGAFDVIVELPVYITMILWRIRRNDHRLLSYLTAGLCVWVLVGAFSEVAVTIYLLHESWGRWGHVWKFVTPFVFSLWIATQLYGASRLFSMSQSERRKCIKGTPQEVEPTVELPGLTDEGGNAGQEESKSKAI